MILNVQMIKGKKFEQQTMQKSKSSFKFLPSAFTCEPQTDETTLKLKKIITPGLIKLQLTILMF